jgi:lipopolysaccharide/colanic/teichoic acid biosynthesis glycosyltransferase
LDPLPPSRRLWDLKYAIEWIMALGAFAILWPLLGVLAVMVKLTSPGPVLYISDRLGRDGQVFCLYKFRTMKVGVQPILSPDGKVITTENDPRLTSIGRFLRLGFDELPQLLNVIKGDMCLIGPRPDVPWERETYSPRERLRLHVLPGITGLTQVVGGRELNSAQNYELDVRYVAYSDAWTDIAIALLTLPYSFGAKEIGQWLFRHYWVGLDQFIHRPSYKAKHGPS